MKTILRSMRWLALGVWLFAVQPVAAQNGLWTLKPGPALGPELSGATINIGTNYFVVSGGVIWLFDSITSTWHLKSPPGSGTIGFAFTIGNKVYVSRLESYDPGSPNDSRAFWEYDAALDSWTRKGGFKCSGVDGQVSFVWNGKGYVGTGRAGGTRTYSNDFWMYDPVANTWTEVASIPGVPRTHGVSFIIGDKAYVGAGAAADFTPPYPNQTPPSDSLLRSFYEYNLANNSWRSIKSLPAGMYRGTGFNIGNTGFVGLGDQYNTPGLKNATVYAYDPGTNRWTEKNKAPVSLPWLVTLWTSNNKAYVRSGNGAYEFDPQFTPPVTWTGMIDNAWSNPANWSPQRVPTANDAVNIQPTAYPHYVVLGDPVEVASLTIQNGASLKLVNGATLTAPGGITNNGFLCGATNSVTGVITGTPRQDYLIPQALLSLDSDTTYENGMRSTLFFGDKVNTGGRNEVDYEFWVNDIRIQGNDSRVFFTNAIQDGDVVYSILKVTGPDCVAESSAPSIPITVRAPQDLNFSLQTEARLGDAPIALALEGPSPGLAPVFGSDNPAIASVADSTLSLHAEGQVQIWVFRPGNKFFAKTDTVRRTLTVTSASFAGVVKKFTVGKTKNGKAIDPLRADATKALGAPQENDTYNFVSLGFGGTITLELEQRLYDDGTFKPDFILVETSFGRADEKCYSDAGVFNYPESAVVQVSPDGTQWRSLPDSYCRTSFIDISSVIDEGFPFVKFIRIKDFTNKELFDNAADGFDLDGIIVGAAAVEEAFTHFTNGRAEQNADVWDAAFFNRLPNEPEEAGAASSIYPNPVQGGNVAIDYASPIDQTVRVAIVSVTGSPVRERAVMVTSGKNTIVENTDSLSKGVYLVRIASSGALVVHRFVRL